MAARRPAVTGPGPSGAAPRRGRSLLDGAGGGGPGGALALRL